MIKIKKYTTILMVAAMMSIASTGAGAEGLSVYCDNQKQVISGDIDTGTSGSILMYLVGDNDDAQSIYGIDEIEGNNGVYSVICLFRAVLRRAGICSGLKTIRR